MNINATLIGQMLTFMVFVWFMMKFVWPPLTKMMRERQQKIVDGLQAAEQGRRALELANRNAKKIREDAKLEAAQLMDKAHYRAVQVVEEAKNQARNQRQQLLKQADTEIKQQVANTQEQLRLQLAQLVVTGAEKIIHKEVDQKVHDQLLQQLASELS